MIFLRVLLWILALALGLLLLLFSLLLFAPLTVHAHFEKETEWTYWLKLRFLGLWIRLPVSKWLRQKSKTENLPEEKDEKAEPQGFVQKMKDMITLYKKYKEVLKKIKAYLKPRLHIDALELKVDYGVGNAALTGILYSMISGPLGILHSILDAHTSIHQRHFLITPHFNETLFWARGEISLRLRLWTLLVAGLKFLKEHKRIKMNQNKESEEEQWQIRWKKS